MWKPWRAAWKGLGVLRSWGRGLEPEEVPAGMLPNLLLAFEGVSCPPQSCMDGMLEEGVGALKAPLPSCFGERSSSGKRVAWLALPTPATAGPLSGAVPGKEVCGSRGGQRSEGGRVGLPRIAMLFLKKNKTYQALI